MRTFTNTRGWRVGLLVSHLLRRFADPGVESQRCFHLGDADLDCGSTDGTLTGETFDGQAIEGADAVRMINEGGRQA